MPSCPNPLNPQIVTGHKGTITGNGQPTPAPILSTLAPLPGQTQAPNPQTTHAPVPRNVCEYKGTDYTTGQRWRDGCDYECVCVDGMSGNYQCTDRCNKYPPLTSTDCHMIQDPNDYCCQIPDCHPTPPPTLAPGMTYAPTPFPTNAPTPALCVYQGVPYRQGETWTDGCDKRCRCEDGMTGTVNCNDRCPKYANTQAGCRMVTDPQDTCCQIPLCENPQTNVPTQVLTGVPGTITGNSQPPTNPLNPLQPKLSVCAYRGTQYQQGQTWDDGCSYTCICDDGMTGHYTCTERCPRVPSVPAECQTVPDPMDLCCTQISCPIQATQAPTPGHTVAPIPYTGPPTQAPPLGTTQAPNPYTTQAPVPRTGMCEYKNQYYREKQVWYDGCDKVCTCENGNTGFYRCQPRCGTYTNVDPSCIMVPDPQDPTCCKMPECPLVPPGGTTPSGPVIIRITPVTAMFTNFPSPTPPMVVTVAPPTAPNGQTLYPPLPTTQAPTNAPGCMYNGRLYHENERWDDGCDFSCVCLDDMTGQYQCTDKCPRMPSIPSYCVLIQDPDNACCKLPYCDFGLTPFPNGVQTPVPNPTNIPGLITATPIVIIPGYVTNNGAGQPSTVNPYSIPPVVGQSQVCVYQGVMYRQGATWDDGCSKTCVCDVNGLYNCRDKCQSFPNLDAACKLRVNPQDPCCLVPDCNPNYITAVPLPGISGTNVPITSVPGTGITGTKAPVLVPTGAPGIFTGSRPPITGNTPSLSGYSSMCIYQGAAYPQGAKWEDGCQYKCECVDAQKGTYRCVERCSNMYFMPQGCTLHPDPNDSCCQQAFCSPDSFPTPTPLAIITPPHPQTTIAPPLHTTTPPHTTISPVVITSRPGPVFQGTQSPIGSTITSYTGKPANMCVYTDGRTFNQGDTWTDGCAYNCICNDASKNDYQCTFRCQVYTSLPQYCAMVDDPMDHCCQKVSCQTVQGVPLQPVSGSNTPTASPTMSPAIQNVVPLGTHTVISGSGLPPGETQPGYFGGRQVCVYKGVVYQAGETWDDACDYSCICQNLNPAVYSCTTKCPKYPPLPSYCHMVDVPGQCCQSLKCDIPNVGAYNPIPQITPNIIPTQAPPNQPILNPQLVVPGNNGPVVGGSNPTGGVVIPPQSLGGVTDRCIYQTSDGQHHVYGQGETWRVNQCDYDCQCVDSHTGYYECKPVCPDYSQGSMPATCHLQNVNGQCCPGVTCQNPDGTQVNPQLNPSLTKVPIYGVMVPGYSGFRPGTVPSNTNTISGQNNVCVYKGSAYHQDDRWDDGCQYSCSCTNAATGLYTCRQKCMTYTDMPSVCHVTPGTTSCCPTVQCDTPPTTPIPTTPIPTTPAGPCHTPDKLTNCNQYDKAVACVGVYEAWARDNCAVTCGYCVDNQPTTPGPCVDKISNCADYGANACTGAYVPWATDNCAKTCDLCPCYDKLSTCNQYDQYACGGRYLAWAQDNCAATCGLCPGSVPKFTTAQPPSVTGSGVVQSGWTLLLKGVAGAPGDLWNLWNSPNTANTNVAAAQRLTSEYMGHYKPALANSLDMCDFEKIKVSVYNHGLEMAYVTFDGRGTGRDNWFSPTRIIDSSYSDIASVQKILNMAGDPATGHEFFIGQPVSGCTGSGWIFVSTRNTCTYEAGTNPGFYYSMGSSASQFSGQSVGSGDVFAIMGLGGTCALGVTTPHTHTATSEPACVYKGHIYHQDEWWTDGCQFNCTCDHAETGNYRCYDLCLTYSNLPAQCMMVKAPGDCCAKPVGLGCDSSQPACLYKNGQIYQEGQSWDDGCDYTCTCVDGSTGRYQCTSMCLDFNLPAACHMDPAPAGKCCPVPKCPEHILLQYPAGYVPK